MITLKFFDPNGNEVDPEEWADAMMIALLNDIMEKYKARASENVSRMVCPVHGGKAELTLQVVTTPEQPVMSIDILAQSCCGEFAQAAVTEAQQSWATE